MKFEITLNGEHVAIVDGGNMVDADEAFARLAGFDSFKQMHQCEWLFDMGYTVERLNMIYATPFDNKTKQPTGASYPLHVDSLDEAQKLFPINLLERTKNTLIYEGLCLSWIRFSL